MVADTGNESKNLNKVESVVVVDCGVAVESDTNDCWFVCEVFDGNIESLFKDYS